MITNKCPKHPHYPQGGGGTMIIKLPPDPNRRPPKAYRHLCWRGNPAKAGLERCNLPRKHRGRHSWERAR